MKLAAILIAALTLARAADAPSAWASASWGMTDAQIKSAFTPGLVVDLPATDENNYKEGRASIGISSVMIEGVDFSVGFLTDGGKALREVILKPVSRLDADEIVFQKLESALTVKYGAPFSSNQKDTSLTTLTSQWKTTTSVIKVQYVNFTALNYEILTLDYVPISKNGYL